MSLLTVTDNPLGIERLQDLINKSGYSLMLQHGTAAYNYFSEANWETNPEATEVYKKYFDVNYQPDKKGKCKNSS